MDRSRRLLNLPEKCRYTGRGITVCVLDTGIEKNGDTGRILAFKDFVGGAAKAYDDNGHGTHVCGIICGSGAASNGRYRGIAPDVGLIVLKTLNSKGQGISDDVLSGMRWVSENRKKYNIRIVNLSIGTGSTDVNDPLVLGAEELWESGVVVITAAGNGGPARGSVSTPGISKKVITVGSCDDNLSGTISFGSGEKSNFSGRGPTRECVIKPDLVAPGSNIVSCGTGGKAYRVLSGTSMSTPMISGAAALLLEKHPDLTPNELKLCMKNACRSLELPPNQQGRGLLDIKKMLEI
ncbi:MAG: S8 family peptidase [Firmicutes bacterium]|nr:S8 family peptidase [Bacillota bacterium]